MKKALYLMGGGAKGAFQAGVIYALRERGIDWDIISGTSIGAINGYFLLKDEMEMLKNLYLKDFNSDFMNTVIEGKTVDNQIVKEIFEKIEDKKNHPYDAFYVNYMPVENGIPAEKTVDVTKLPTQEGIDSIIWSSLLPYNNPPMTFRKFIDYMKTHNLEEKFKEDLENHVYDGLNLDGGFFNNVLIWDDVREDVSSILVIGFNGTREDYLKKLGEKRQEVENIITFVSADIPFETTDTYMFEPEFLIKRFNEGYEKGRKLNIED